MSSNSLRSMYKSKIREETTISSRRKSRGVERKKKREDEVNKRRLVSDDMSPVVEDHTHSFDDDEDKKKPGKEAVHQKASSRLELLKQWREEKKRKTEKGKKESKKPMFKVSPVKYSGESNLYMRTVSNEIKPAKKTVTSFQAKLAAAGNDKKSVPSHFVKEVMKPVKAVGPTKAKTAPSQVGAQVSILSGVVSNTRQNRITRSAQQPQPTKETSTRSTRQTVASKPSAVVNPPVVQVAVRQRGKMTDLASKMTASAAAKAKTNLDKPKEFLRAKSRVTRGAVQNTKREYSKKQNNGDQEKEEAVPVDLVEENNNEDAVAVSDSSPDSKELHLSDSAVSSPRHSTPAPRRSTRVKRESERKDKLDLDDSTVRVSRRLNMRAATPYSSRRNLSAVNAFDEGCEKENSSITLSSQEKVIECNLFIESVEMAQCTPDKAQADKNIVIPSVEMSPESNIAVGLEPQSSKKSDPQRTESDENAVNDLEMSDKENVHEDIQIRDKMLRKSASRWNLNVTDVAQLKRKSHRLSVASKGHHGTTVELHTPLAEKSRDASESRNHKQRLVSSNDGEIETLMVDRTTPSTTKRLKRLVTVSPSLDTKICSNLGRTDTDITQLPVIEYAKPSFQEVTIYSAVASRRSVRIAGLVSSSDTNSENENTEKAQYPKTPRFKRRQSTRTSLVNHESHRSTFVSVSDEGTSDMIGEIVLDEMKIQATPRHMHHLAMSSKSTSHRRSVFRSEVIDVSDEGTALPNDLDPGTVYQVGKPSESSSRVLQELAVKKFDGEVPVDESADHNVSIENMSPSKQLTVSAIDAQVMAEDNDITSTTAVSEEGSQSTQPFTPRVSSETSKLTLSSPENTATLETPLAQSATTSNTPRSSRNRGLSMNGFSSFKTPGEPASAVLAKSQRKRRRTQTAPIKSPEQMIEILKKSPMIEMTRRRSRHVSSPDIMNPTNLDALLAASLLNNDPKTVPIDAESTKFGDAICKTPAGLSQSQPIEQVLENGGIRYFRELLVSETNRLNQLCNQWNEITRLTANLNEDAQGQIRSAVGKAQLLIDQRFKQFSGLVDDCEFSLGEKETTLTDLQGFWEMIYFQVENVNQLFAQLSELQQKNWDIKRPSPTKDVRKRKAAKINKPKVKSNFAAFREEIQRRKVQAAIVKSSSASVDSEDSEIAKTVDDGYLQVKSPEKSPPGENIPLTPVVSDAEQSKSSSQENFTQVVEKPANNIDVQQLATPVSHGNKENNIPSSSHRFSAMSAKRLSYLPVVPSPLLNDITGLGLKK